MAIVEQDDEELVRLVLGGERESFAVLVDRYKRGITNFIGASVRSPSDVADLAQETFMRAYAHLGTFNPNLGRFSTWIYHIARNVIRTHLGKSQRRLPLQDLGEDRTLDVVADTAPEADPARGILRAEAEADVRAALAELPERTRAVLSLRYYDNMEYQSIAETMGLSLGNVKTLIHRGKLALAQKLLDRERDALASSRSARPWRCRMRCSSCEKRLDAYVDGSLSPRERTQVAAHVAACPACASLLEEFRVIDALLVTPRTLEPAANFTFKVMAEVRCLPRPHAHRSPALAVLGTYVVFAWVTIGAFLIFARGAAL
ncbi:MAG: sigma-70 family RNA polymerase sigma factor, partial [Candidatus Eremiobacteraeota bacterium]|nr:sigma-70 family RNA polymerase sigma factor [Candidatus Eremiobacteraeota bacterium]